MRYSTLAEGKLTVSSVCLGTMTFGQQNDLSSAHSQLDLAFDAGVNFFDTAELYPVPARAETYGHTEAIVGAWLSCKPRDRIVVATKVAGPSRNLSWIRGGPPALDRENIRAAIDGSLARLKTDYVDLYQLHWPERNAPIFGQHAFDPTRERQAVSVGQQLEVLRELVDEGKVRFVGLSNETPWGACEFLRVAKTYGLPRVVSIQNAYNLLNRVFDYGLAEVCHREDLGLLAYSPLAMGHLSAKYLDNPEADGRIKSFPGFAQRYTKENVQSAVRAYASLARSRGIAPATLALAFVAGRPCVASTIIGATTLAQLEQNLAAFDHVLDAETRGEIDRIHVRFTNPAP